MYPMQSIDPLSKIAEFSIAMFILAVGTVFLWRFFLSERKLLNDRIDARDMEIKRLNEERHKDARDMISTMNALEGYLKDTKPTEARELIIRKLDDLARVLDRTR